MGLAMDSIRMANYELRIMNYELFEQVRAQAAGALK